MRRNILALCLAIAFTNSVNAIVFAEAQDQTLESLLADARAAQSRGDFDSAAKRYRQALELGPASAELWANLGLMYHQLGKSDEAIQSLTKAARMNPSLFVPQLFLGIEYLETKNAAVALPYLERAAKLNPVDVQARLSMGRAFEMLDRPDRAAAAYERGTEIAPQNGNAWLNLGTAYLQQVENDARLMTARYKESPAYNLRAAETLAEQGKLAQAEKAYKKALASASPPTCTRAELGITLLREDRVAEGREQFQFERKGTQRCGLALLGSAVGELAEDNVEAGLEELNSLMAVDAVFVRSNLALFRGALSVDRVKAILEFSRKRVAEQSHELASVIEQAFLSDETATAPDVATGDIETRKASPTEADSLYRAGRYSACDQALKTRIHLLGESQKQMLASCSFYTGDFRTTLRAAEALKSNPGTKAQGLYWESKADQKLAVAALNRAGEIDPDSPRMHALIGDVLRQRRRWSEAEIEYRKAVALDPKSRYGRLSLAIVLFTELKSDESFQVDQSLLKEVPDDLEANLLAGEILVQENELQKAEPYLTKCRALSNEFAPRVHILLGQVYAETGRVADAIAEYQQGLPGDENGSAHYQLGRLYLRNGDKAAAEQTFSESKRLVKQWNDRALPGAEQLDVGAKP